MSAIEKGDILKSRRYRNRRLGDFLKELDLTEGRSTGVPTIQEKLADNGSPRATFETTEDRLTFLVHIPIHAGCGNNPATEKTTVITTEKSAIGSWTSQAVKPSAEKNGSGSEKSSEKNAVGSEKNQAIIAAIKINPRVTAAEIAMKLGVSSRAVEKRIKTLRESGAIRRVGGDKGGYWEVIEKGTEQ
jgi:ATP-dependent DNA helicase RecG